MSSSSPPLFPPEEGRVVRVALPLPVDRLFDYKVPAPLARASRPGCRVRVQAGSRRLVGVIVEQIPSPQSPSDPDREPGAPRPLRPLLALLDDEPALPPSLLAALLEEARACLCPIGIALAGALPAGAAPRTARGLRLTTRGRTALASGAVEGGAGRVLRALAGGGRTPAELRRMLGGPPSHLEELVRDRWIEPATLDRSPRVRRARIQTARLAEHVACAEVCGGVLRHAPRQAELLREIARQPGVSTRSLTAGQRSRAEALRALVRRGLVLLREETPALRLSLQVREDPTLTLTREQAQACQEIGAAVRERRPQRFLLHGVTGSGKTEVYLRAVAVALEQGRQALVLVPEITLTHQILGRLHARFGDQLAVLHSGMPPGQRLAQWERLRRGEVPIAVGARSALFAPTRDLGVIIVDEEHDGAYKNEEGFRYHARSLAARRAGRDGCPLVLGSATPSLESRYAAERGDLRRLRLPHRIASRPLPAVEIVDLARERAAQPRGRKLILTPPLLRALREVLAEQGQALLFLNRRGFSSQIACFDCQHVERCKHCDIALTYHAASRALCCHYCGYRTDPPEVCPSCGSPSSALLGIGTERVEEEVRIRFPEARIARLDRDTAVRRGSTEQLLRALARREVDIVVGTQMLAKGHDFPGVRLVGVVNADLGLHLPDFRAAERTFQLLTQVAGRAGRGATPGRVIVQSFCPDHYAIRPVARHDYEAFYAEELRHRRELGYPPVGQLARIQVDDPDEAAARRAAEQLARRARVARGQGLPCEVLGPAPAPIARLRGRHRMHVLLKHPRRQVLLEVARQVAAEIPSLPGRVRASVDVRPLDML